MTEIRAAFIHIPTRNPLWKYWCKHSVWETAATNNRPKQQFVTASATVASMRLHFPNSSRRWKGWGLVMVWWRLGRQGIGITVNGEKTAVWPTAATVQCHVVVVNFRIVTWMMRMRSHGGLSLLAMCSRDQRRCQMITGGCWPRKES